MVDKEWREFEKLVSKIEKQLAPKGAIIKSPDRIKDKITGQLREVDASIRYYIGSIPVLITVECRKRKKVQDDIWIEQLAKKKEKIGADLTVAVTSSDFTEPAIKSADFFNIKLRKITDVTNSDISSWVQNIHIQKITLFDSIEKWTIEVDEDEAQFSQELANAIKIDPNVCKLVFRFEDNLGLSIQDMVNTVYRWQSEGHLGQESYEGLSGDKDKIKRRIAMDFAPNTFYTLTQNGKSCIKSLSIDLISKIERETIPLSTVYQYADLKNEITQIALGDFEVGPKPEDKYKILVQPEAKQ